MNQAGVNVSSGRFWAFVPVGMLACVLVGLSSIAVIASDDPNFAVEHDYYRKAVAWDATQHQLAENQRLAYQLQLPDSLPRAANGHVTLALSLRDSLGKPINDARVRAEAFANAHADRVSELSLTEAAPGLYRVEFVPASIGLWEFRFDVQRAGERFTAILRRDVGERGPA